MKLILNAAQQACAYLHVSLATIARAITHVTVTKKSVFLTGMQETVLKGASLKMVHLAITLVPISGKSNV